MSLRRNVRELVPGAGGLIWLSLCVLPCGFPIRAVAQSPQTTTIEGVVTGTIDARETGASAGEPQPDRQLSGSINGTVTDQDGAVAIDARVQLTREDQPAIQEVLSGDNGQFSFADLPAGPFQLTVTAEGFRTQMVSGVLAPGQAYLMPAIRLAVATVVTEVRVALTQIEVAQEQIKEQEKQRVLGFIPNFYVSYVPDAAPLATKQKFELAWRSTIDPFTFVGVGALAGVQQATDDFEGYGQGAQGYAKRFGAAYADVLAGTYIGSAILPSLLKQDPRYFYKGTGRTRSRFLYAVANTAICKGDNKRWQPNYSVVLGSFAAGGISYLYYPASDRDAMNLVLQNSLIRIGESALANVLQEFVVRKLTPRLHSHPPAQP
jgi:Carboxypeptidase regulatory-like domain